MRDEPKGGWEQYREGVKKLPRRRTPPPTNNTKAASKITPILKTKSPGPSSTLLEISTKSYPPSSRRLVPLDHDESFSFSPKLDRSREKQLRAGTLPIEAKIDLHGLKQSEAYDVLQEFLSSQIASGHRHVLVITGKGIRQQGILRHQLPLWLKTMPEGRHILRMCHAAPRHGGEGAYYILLKNPKKLLKR